MLTTFDCQSKCVILKKILAMHYSCILALRCALSAGLMGSAPERPCYDVGGLDAALGQFCRDAADFLDGPADQGRAFRRIRRVFGGGAALARQRMAAIMAKASITSETWRCQPCHERVSL